MIGIQILSVMFGLAALFFSYSHYRRKNFDGTELAIWFIIWIGFILVSLFPTTVSPWVQTFGFARLMDFVLIIAFIVVYCILLHNYMVVRKVERRLEKLVRNLAIKDLENEEEDQKDS
ncbi:MAG: DUF2304 domain-containing protein [Candidatus Peregrinibacteria bacterium]|nr:DUF2304 domain-containing protein [Candidatus Peregrinibacteria bacterium]